MFSTGGRVCNGYRILEYASLFLRSFDGATVYAIDPRFVAADQIKEPTAVRQE
jgi:hypothetical protein